MSGRRWSAEEKYRIVMEALTTSAETVEICRKYGLSPNAFYPWWKRFLESAKAATAGKSNTTATKALQKENDRLKTLLAESALAVDALKKPWRGVEGGAAHG